MACAVPVRALRTLPYLRMAACACRMIPRPGSAGAHFLCRERERRRAPALRTGVGAMLASYLRHWPGRCVLGIQMLAIAQRAQIAALSQVQVQMQMVLAIITTD